MQAEEIEIQASKKTGLKNSLVIDDKVLVVNGRFIKIARFKKEWFEYVDDPETFIEKLKKTEIKADIFTFRQRLPETKPKHSYFVEKGSVAAIPITSYDFWFEKQIKRSTRRAIKKAEKKGVCVEVMDFNDDLVKGITDIVNETPVRQGKLYAHYGKDFETVKREFSEDMERCVFIGAFFKNELIGFVKLFFARKYGIPYGMVSKLKHRDKSSQNALIAKAVEICDRKEIPFILYGEWSRGGLGDFKRSVGCEKIDLPKYYIPLSIKGKIALKLYLHNGIRGIIPEKIIISLIELRERWYLYKFRHFTSFQNKA